MVGLLTPWLTYRIASRIFNEQVGIMAAAIVAIYAYFIIYAGSLMTEALYIVSVLWCVDAGMRLAETTVSPVERFPASDGWPRIFLGLQLGIALRSDPPKADHRIFSSSIGCMVTLDSMAARACVNNGCTGVCKRACSPSNASAIRLS